MASLIHKKEYSSHKYVLSLMHKKEYLRLDSSQQDLVRLCHASSCKSSPGECIVHGCAFFKGLDAHIMSRLNRAPRCSGCDLPRCRELNGYLAHFWACTDEACPYCSGLSKIGFRRKRTEETKKRTEEPEKRAEKRARAEVDAADAMALLCP